jgi:beta-1,4-mannosyltransferase
VVLACPALGGRRKARAWGATDVATTMAGSRGQGPRSPQERKHVVWVVVLGDFGRSPRMQYHTASLAAAGAAVHVVASPGGSSLIPELADNPDVTVHAVSGPPSWTARLPAPLALAIKAGIQLLSLLWLLLVALPAPAAILMQNPPALPTMAACAAAAARHRAVWVVDWHNTAYSILALKHGHRRWLIGLARTLEASLGRLAGGHLCVTSTMRDWLCKHFGVAGAEVLYDRPPSAFRPRGADDVHELLCRLGPQLSAAAIGGRLTTPHAGSGSASGSGSGLQGETLLTRLSADGSAEPRRGRPALVVSSTSWTPDEDFGLLLDAAVAYDAAAGPHHPDVLLVVTGRGPQRDAYLAAAAARSLSRVTFCSIWLEPGDYPRLLAAADLGVCLHTSSSGLDLPMKVVDMYGSGIPVCAVEYACITELVTPGRTGLLFSDAEELAAQLLRLLGAWDGAGPAPGCELAQLRSGVAEDHLQWRWEDNWRKVAAPLLLPGRSGSGAVSSPCESRRSSRRRAGAAF